MPEPVLLLSDDGQRWFSAPPCCAFWSRRAIDELCRIRGYRMARIAWLLGAEVPPRAPWGFA